MPGDDPSPFVLPHPPAIRPFAPVPPEACDETPGDPGRTDADAADERDRPATAGRHRGRGEPEGA